jgi:YegS/Rv2252/BmrU family lipid kinase
VRAELKRTGTAYRFYLTAKERNASFLAKLLLKKVPGEVTIVTLGGDGTVNEVLQGIAAAGAFARVRLGYIPAGSSNDLARALQLPQDPVEMLHRILSDEGERRIDLGRLLYRETDTPEMNGKQRYFVVSAGIGFDAAVCEEALRTKDKAFFNRIGLGALSYGFLCVKRLLLSKGADFQITLDGKRVHAVKDSLFVAIMNHKYQGGGVMFAPDAADDDGELDLCFTDRMSRLNVLMTFPKAYSGSHVGTPGVRLEKARKIRIVSTEPLYVHTDGEVQTRAVDISVRCLPGKLRLLA